LEIEGECPKAETSPLTNYGQITLFE